MGLICSIWQNILEHLSLLLLKAGNEYRVQFPNPDFAAMASSAGGLGIRVTESDELDEAISQALISPLYALVEVLVDPDLFAGAVRGI